MIQQSFMESLYLGMHGYAGHVCMGMRMGMCMGMCAWVCAWACVHGYVHEHVCMGMCMACVHDSGLRSHDGVHNHAG